MALRPGDLGVPELEPGEVEVNIGELLDGDGALAQRFDVRRQIGKGGFAVVYEAVDRRTGQLVALKVLEPDDGVTYDRKTRARFRREVDALAVLRSPHTVRLFDHGELDGRLFAVFELVGGEDLSKLLERRGMLPVPEALHLLQQILRSLAEAHECGIVHRDLKPENIRVMEADGDPLFAKLLDFGISRSVEHDGSVTATGELVGTPRYMAPEQLKGLPPTPASDVYSAGLIAFEMLLGRDSLHGHRWADQLHRLQSGHLFSAPQLEHLGPLLATVQRMTASRPDARFATAGDVLRALEPPPDTNRYLPLALMLVTLVVGLAVVAVSQLREDRSETMPVRPVGAATGVALTQPRERLSTPMAEPAPDVGTMKAYLQRPGAIPSPGCSEPLGVVNAQVHLPDRYDPSVPLPLIILMHADNNAPDELLAGSGFQQIADREGLMVVAPDGRIMAAPALQAWRLPKDEDKVLRAFDEMRLAFCVDESRVFLVATGDGGRKVHPLMNAPWLRAVAINSYLENHDVPPPRSGVPIIWVLPSQSRHVPLDGSPNCSDNRKKTIEDLEKDWRGLNGCSASPESDESLGLCKRWSCRSPLEICVVPGGEGWVPSGYPEKCLDPAPAQLPRAEKIWEFFKAAPPRAE